MIAIVTLAFLGACAEDTQYEGLFTPTNNEISSQWRGTYTGTGRLTHPPLIDAQLHTVEIRVTDMGDETVRIRAFLMPDFPFSETSRLEGRVESLTRCRISRNVDDQWYTCTLAKAGRTITGSIAVYPLGQGVGGSPDWTITSISVLKDVSK